MTDPLKRPVHKILIKPSHIEKLAKEGRLPKELVQKVKLPVEEEKPKKLVTYERPKFNTSGLAKTRKQSMLRAKLRVIHDKVPGPSENKVPPCDTCKAVPCCYAFLITLTEDEFESGLYDEYAVNFTSEMLEQLDSDSLLIAAFGGPVAVDDNIYLLDSKAGDPCPFLTQDNRCGIYENRPIMCRSYTCVGDARITEEMRNGTEVIFPGGATK